MSRLSHGTIFSIVACGCICVLCRCSGAEYEAAVSHALRTLGQPVGYCPRIEPTEFVLRTRLPEQVRVHKVVPRAFSEELIDQLLKITDLDRNQTFRGSRTGVFATPGVRYYGSLEKNHTLAIIPAQGWIHYTRMEAVDDKGARQSLVPSEDEALARGLEFARVFGLGESDFARHPLKNRLDYLFCKTEGGPVLDPPQVKSMEVFFRRAIDGHPVHSRGLYGGLWVGFGFRGMLYKFELTARATEPIATIRLAPISEQLRVFAESKQVYASPWPFDSDELKKDKNALLRLELVEVVYFEDAPEKVQKIIPPLLRWEGELQFKSARHFVAIFTPIQETKRD